MNIIIPLGGKGTRFAASHSVSKPLIEINGKSMIETVIDCLNISLEDNLYIFYNNRLDLNNLKLHKYNPILIAIPDTLGAAETLLYGLDHVNNDNPLLVIDCDTCYRQDIILMCKNSDNKNLVFYTYNDETIPIYSYICINNNNIITDIAEKHKISNNANTGAYAFSNAKLLKNYCNIVLSNNLFMNGEPYTSCVIKQMLLNSITFSAVKLKECSVISFGTPDAIKKYNSSTYAFLFDMDGTIVKTDNLYFEVWKTILLEKFYIKLTENMYECFIKGQTDEYIKNTLLRNENVILHELSKLKDKLFLEKLSNIIITDGFINFFNNLYEKGYLLGVVTNSNKIVAEKILETINIKNKLSVLVTADDCINGKPNKEPYEKAIKTLNILHSKVIIFEDLHSGYLSAKQIHQALIIGIELNADLNIKSFYDITEDTCLDLLFKKQLENIISGQIEPLKLKGGFISDVIKVKTINGMRIFKYENNKTNNLSKMATQLDLYNREYYFYEYISSHLIDILRFPKLDTVIREVNINGILLEDLSQYVLNKDLSYSPIKTTFNIIDKMAEMHNKFCGKDLKTLFPKLKQPDDECFYPFIQNFINDKKNEFIEKWANAFNSNIMNMFLFMFNNFNYVQQRLINSNYKTLIHGDIKSPNIFYDNDDPIFIDWQHCACGIGSQDFVFFLVESFNQDFINNHGNTLVDHYVSLLKITENIEHDLYDLLCYIPFFTAVWFGTISPDELIDKSFPHDFINKMFSVYTLFNKKFSIQPTLS